jgi:hypothetical protein
VRDSLLCNLGNFLMCVLNQVHIGFVPDGRTGQQFADIFCGAKTLTEHGDPLHIVCNGHLGQSGFAGQGQQIAGRLDIKYGF